MSQCPCDEITEWVPALRSPGDALARRRQGRRLAQHRPIVTQTAVLGFGLSGVQTDSAVTSVVGAAAADVAHVHKGNRHGTTIRTGTTRWTSIGRTADTLRDPSQCRVLTFTSSSNTCLTNAYTSLLAGSDAVRAGYTWPQRRRTDAEIGRAHV